MSENESLAGKTIVITGASSGIGRGAAIALAATGANVVIAARRGSVLEALAGEIAESGGIALPVQTDVSRSGDVHRLALMAAERFGRIDVWVNNVGVGALGLFWDVPVEDHARVVEVNLTGYIFGAHVALRHFREHGDGILVNIGSVESSVPLAYQSSYAATKAGVLSLGRSLNEELRLAGLDDTIKVGTIMPWAVDTPWWVHAANYTGHNPRMLAMDDPSVVVDAIVAACSSPKPEQPVGAKARAALVSHDIFPGLTTRVSAKTVDVETKKGHAVPPTRGALYDPVPEGTAVEGGIRERMKWENASQQDATSDAAEATTPE